MMGPHRGQRDGGDSGEVRSRRPNNGPARARYHQFVMYPHQPGSEVSCCMKYVVFGFNVVFWILGAAILLVGIYALIEKLPISQLGSRLDYFYLDPAWLLVILGGITFVLGFSGCIGALRENVHLLCFYSSVVSILLIAQLAIAVLGFVFKGVVTGHLADKLDVMIIKYRDDDDLQAVIDWIQGEWLNCCGVIGPDDWDKNIYFNSTAMLGSPEAGGVPFSCCDIDKDDESGRLKNLFCGHKIRRPDYDGRYKMHGTGCIQAGTSWVNENMTIIGSVMIGVAVLQIFSICFAQSLRTDILSQRNRYRSQHHA